MYGVKYQRIFDYQKGYRNEIWPVLTDGGQMLNVTFYKREVGIAARIRRADTVSGYLADMGIPTRRRADDRILALRDDKTTVHIGIYNYLSGETIPWEAYTMSHLKLLGMTMSNMHSLLSNMPTFELPSVYDEYTLIIQRMKEYFLRLTTTSAVERKLGLRINNERLNKYARLLQKIKRLPGQQVLHMDFVRGNILFDGKNISGVLDFEKTAFGHSFVDIARTLAFLLVDCKYKSSDKVIKYFLYSGYQKRGQNKDIGDTIVLNELIEMFLSYDFYKFLRHNPYESLCQNEHYIRTRDMLVERGVIFYG